MQGAKPACGFSREAVSSGVAWLRTASAAVVFAVWRRPWRLLARMTAAQRRVLLAIGAVLAAMNSLFYLAVDRLPLSTVGAIEFLGTVVLAAAGARTRRNLLALALAIGRGRRAAIGDPCLVQGWGVTRRVRMTVD